jgi:hypothetical protein
MEQVTTVLELMGMMLIAAAVAAAIAVAGPDQFAVIVAGAVLGAEFLGISWLLNGGLASLAHHWLLLRSLRQRRAKMRATQ